MLRPDQIADLSILISNPKHLHLSEPGTGKTPTICTYQRFLWDEHGTPSIWTQPKSLLEKNREEAIRWGGWAPEDVVIVDGTQSQVDAQLAKPAKVFLMGFRRFALEQEKFPRVWRATQIDEFHKGFGGDDSAATQALYSFMARQGEFFTPMTGTLIDGKLETAFPAVHIIEPRYYGHFKAFCNYHRILDPFTGKQIGYQQHEKLQKILQNHGIRRLFSDIFGPQEVITQVEWLSMASEQRRLYDKFEDEAILELENFFVTGEQPGVAFIRARQIMEHPNRFPDFTSPGDFIDILNGQPNAKLERLELHYSDHIETGKPLIVFAAMVPQQHECLELAQKLGMRVGFIGDVPTPERARVDRAFRAGELDTIICSPKVADAGFNWQFCGRQEVEHMIFASLDYKDTTFVQAMRRAIREARARALRVTVLAYKNSVDNRIMQLIERKSREANRVDPTREIIDFRARAA